jgi:hypothetical protein
MTRKAREIRALDEQIALQAKILADFQVSYEVGANRKLNIAAQKQMHDKASYQVLKSSELALLNFHSGLILARFCLAEKVARY